MIGLCRDSWQSFGAAKTKLGDMRGRSGIGGVEVVLVSHRNQALGRELFTNVGIDPAAKRILVVKSANHFRDAFGPIAAEVLYADGNGNVPIDCRSHPFTKVMRPLWPLDPQAGRPFRAVGTSYLPSRPVAFDCRARSSVKYHPWRQFRIRLCRSRSPP